MKQTQINLTRGFGLLENFLAKKRADAANLLMQEKHKEGRVLDIGCGSFPYFLVSSKAKEKYGIDPAINLRTFNSNKHNIILKKK